MKKTVKLTVSFKDDFIPFLEDHQACKDYVVSVLKRHHNGNENEAVLQDRIYEKLQCIGPFMWINGMFIWDETSKGNKFWHNISDLWYKFLWDEAGIKDFDIIGEISKSDVQKLFFSLRGKYYRVTDLSYNRPVTDEWNCKEWKPCEHSVELHEAGGIYLILSNYPEDKIIFWHDGLSSRPRPMIKVWVPELDQAQWVFYKECNVQKTE